MIKKLKTKISLIILFAISIPVLFLVILFDISYYNNLIRSNSGFVDRFFGGPKDDFNDKRENKNDNKNENKIDMMDIDGVYSFVINNNEIIRESDNASDEIKEYAIKLSNKKTEDGIIGNYIYKKRIHDDKDNEIEIILIESTSEINKIRVVLILTTILSWVGVLLIYFLSKKIANIIVKPVEETFSKQSEFISDASHELKTPLAVIEANADVLEGEIGKNKWLSYIQNESDNMNKLINELLLLTKIENIDKLRKPEKFNISDHVEIVTSSFESMAYEKKVNIKTDIQKDIVLDKFNKEDIEHILSTLIDNAIKHTDKNKRVIVELKKYKDNIKINVKNEGKEIPESERDKIFDRFYRIDKARNRNEKRYGLGLAIAKSTVLKNNGTINVDYKDGFTIFTVKLPI